MAHDNFRIEKDSFGELKVPANALWGAQTQRSLQHFAISSERMPDELIRALAQVKHACAGNLCRCTGYYKIVKAIENASKLKT